jgi:hypothetical protein
MEVTAFLADSAETVNGKIYAMGIGWDLLMSPTFPFAFPRVALGIMIHVGWTETDIGHELRVHLETEDGQVVPLTQPDPRDPEQTVTTEWGSTFSVGRPEALSPGSDQIVPFSLNVNDLSFPGPGGYSWVIAIDGEVTTHLPLKVALAPTVAL